jgi:hypothetical protein
MMANLILVGTNAVHFLLQSVEPNAGSMTPEQFRQQIALEAVRHNPANGPVSILVPIALFAMILAIVWLGMRQKQARLRIQAELHKQLLDKFGSGREFAEFLASPGSQRFLEGLWSKSSESKERPLRNGIILATLGLALVGLSLMKKGLLIPGVIVLALGAGFLISSAISYRLAKELNQPKESRPGNALTS